MHLLGVIASIFVISLLCWYQLKNFKSMHVVRSKVSLAMLGCHQIKCRAVNLVGKWSVECAVFIVLGNPIPNLNHKYASITSELVPLISSSSI